MKNIGLLGRSCFLVLVIALMPAAVLYAESEQESKPSVEDTFRYTLSNKAGGYLRYLPYSGVEKQPGKVGILETGTGGSYEFLVFDKLPLTVSGGLDYINIDKTVSLPLPVSLFDFGVALEGKLPLFSIKNIYFGASINPSFACDSRSFGADSFYLPARFFGIYIPNDKLIIIGGVEFFTNFDSDVQPIGGVIYKPTDRLTFNFVTDDPHIFYKVSDQLGVRAEGGYRFWDQFKVRRQDDSNVLFEYKEMWLGGGLNFSPVKTARIFVTMGGVFDRGLKYPHGGGKVDIDKGYYLQGAAIAEF